MTVCLAKSYGDGFQRRTYEKVISTPKGGTDVSHVVNQLLDSLLSKAKRKAGKGIEITPVHVKNNFWAKRK